MNELESNPFLYPPKQDIVDKYGDVELTGSGLKLDLKDEAVYSSLIENETSEESIYNNLIGLEVASSVGETSPFGREITVGSDLLKQIHYYLMKGQAYNFPGKYRKYNVVVGNHRPPKSHQVDFYMNRLDDFISDESISPVLRSIWGHIQFEMIHPFQDGNGRTGRALINALIPDRNISEYIWENRSEYYSHLASPDFDSWWEWLYSGLNDGLAV